METKRKLLCGKGLTKVSSLVSRQPVSLGTEVPEEVKAEDLLAAPNEAAFRKETSKLNKLIAKITRRLGEKRKRRGDPSADELWDRKRKLQEEQVEVHKQRKGLEATLRSLARSIKAVLLLELK